MSFLQSLQNRKLFLRNTETVVTRADGTVYIEKHFGSSNTSIVSQKSTVGFIIDTAPDDVPALVIPCLYVGSQDCCAPEVLSRYNIRSVLSVGIEAPCRQPNTAYSYYPCLDLPETDIKQIILECNKLIKKSIDQSEHILVHCNAGVSRSISIVIGFLMCEEGKTYEEAYKLIKSVRPCMQPNVGFVNQLKKLQNS